MFDLVVKEEAREYALNCKPVRRKDLPSGKEKWHMTCQEKYYIFTSTFKLFIKLFIHKTKIDKFREIGFDKLQKMVAK